MQYNYNNSFINVQDIIHPDIGRAGKAHPAVLKILNIAADEAVLGMKTRTALSGTHGERFHDQFCLFKIQRQQIIEISASISKRLMALGNLPISESRAYLIYTRLDQISGDISYLINTFAN